MYAAYKKVCYTGGLKPKLVMTVGTWCHALLSLED